MEKNSDILLDKLGNLLDYIDIHLRRIKVDNIHRLPSVTSLKPIIVKFCSFLDRNYICTNRSRLAGHQLRVIIREHFAKETESNMKTLSPIKRYAIKIGLRVSLNVDKLRVNGFLYSVKNLHTLPTDLKPENVAIRELENHLIFTVLPAN